MTKVSVTSFHRAGKDTCLLPRDSALWPSSPSLLSQAMGEFLSRYAWEWWGTVTFRDEVCTYTAQRAARALLSHIERAAGRHIGAFYVLERHRYRGGDDPASLTPHIHFLALNVAGVSRRAVWRWAHMRYGRTRIEPYDPHKGASYYVAKYVGKEALDRGEWELWRPETIQAAGCPLQVGI